jgi:hypothetical protein
VRACASSVAPIAHARTVRLGLDVEGLYRIAGSNRQADALTLQFRYGRYVVTRASSDTPSLPLMLQRPTRPRLDAAEWSNVHVLTAVLKQYLRSLPDAVIHRSAYDAFDQASGIWFSTRPAQVAREQRRAHTEWTNG